MSRLPVAAARPAPTTALPAELQADQLPSHVAVIMDGNGRWARQRGLPRVIFVHGTGREVYTNAG